MNTFELIEFIGITIASSAYGISKYIEFRKSKSKNTPSDFIKIAKRDGKIYAELHNIRNRFRARRVYIMQFKNGGYYFSGESVKSMSMTHEVWDYPLQSIKDDNQNIPLSFADKPYLEALLTYGIYSVDAVENLNDDDALKAPLLYRGAKSIYMSLLIHPKTKESLGILTLTFSTINGLHSIDMEGVKGSGRHIRDLLIL